MMSEVIETTYHTTHGTHLEGRILANYMRSLVDRFFKILPIKEGKDVYGVESLDAYLNSLLAELLGCKELIIAVNHDSAFLSLLSILQYLIDNPDCSVRTVKREVFRAITICNSLKARYAIVERAGDSV